MSPVHGPPPAGERRVFVSSRSHTAAASANDICRPALRLSALHMTPRTSQVSDTNHRSSAPCSHPCTRPNPAFWQPSPSTRATLAARDRTKQRDLNRRRAGCAAALAFSRPPQRWRPCAMINGAVGICEARRPQFLRRIARGRCPQGHNGTGASETACRPALAPAVTKQTIIHDSDSDNGGPGRARPRPWCSVVRACCSGTWAVRGRGTV